MYEYAGLSPNPHYALRITHYALRIQVLDHPGGDADDHSVGRDVASDDGRRYRQREVIPLLFGLTLHRLDQVLAGDLDELIEALIAADQVVETEEKGR